MDKCTTVRAHYNSCYSHAHALALGQRGSVLTFTSQDADPKHNPSCMHACMLVLAILPTQ